MAHKHVVVAGNIGVGKSSFCALYAKHFKVTPVYEAVEDNPYLQDFYADMPRWAFPTQVFFFSQRVKQHRDIMAQKGPVVQDRSIYEDAEVFARNLFEQKHMHKRDFETYLQLYQAVVGGLVPPRLIIYLRASLPVLKQRIAKRGRSYERAIPDAYLSRLGELYDRWAASYESNHASSPMSHSLSRIVSFDTDSLDFVKHPDDLQRIFASLPQV